MSTAKPYLRPCSARNSGEPARFLPKWKLKPIITPLTANLPTRMRATKSSAVVAANAALNVSTTAPSRPVAARSRSLARFVGQAEQRFGRDGKSRAGAARTSAHAAGRPSSSALLRATAITAWWPRCTPSKLPMARTAPRSAPSGAVSRTTRKRFGAISLHALGKPDRAYVPPRPCSSQAAQERRRRSARPARAELRA